MAKAKAGAKKAKPAAKKATSAKIGLLKTASKKMVKAAARVVQVATKLTTKEPAGAKESAAKPAEKTKAAAPIPVVAPKAAPEPKGKAAKAAKAAEDEAALTPRQMPRATKLPPPSQPLTKREMEQLLTAGTGRGVEGEGSLKGRLIVKEEFPFLQVIGRDKRELLFLLQGPDQEVLPAYVDHKVSVSGFIRKTTNYGGSVDVRKYSAKKPELEVAPVEAAAPVEKLKYLSPGEVEQMCSAGMGAGMKGFASMRGNLEMTGDDFFLVVSNGGTRHQVSFLLEGKGVKGLRKHVGHTLQINGVVEKTAGWGGKVQLENFEPRMSERKSVSRDAMDVVEMDADGTEAAAETRVNQGLAIRLVEKAGFTWAIEPMVAKRVGLREANFEPGSGGQATREFFFTPRTPGAYDVDFFLAKAFSPAQVSKTFKLTVTVKP